jgi:GTP-binding protein HflX
LNGEGIEALLVAIEEKLGALRQTFDLRLDPSDGAGLSWLHRHTEVLSRGLDSEGRMALRVRADAATAGQARRKFPEPAK